MKKNTEKPDDPNSKILEKLDTIIAMLAIQGKSEDDQIKILRSLNFSFRDIGKLVGMSEGNVRRLLKK